MMEIRLESLTTKYFEETQIFIELEPRPTIQDKIIKFATRCTHIAARFKHYAGPVILPIIFISYITFSIYLAIVSPMSAIDLYVDGFTKDRFAICPYKGINIRLLILIASAPGNFEKRLAVRRTWGSISRPDVNIGFVLGQAINQTVDTEAIEKEERQYKDIIIAKLPDSYRFLPLKTLAILKWAHKYCSYAKFLMKADDDSFINVPAWLAITELNKTVATKSIWGYNIAYTSEPIRNELSRYYVSYKQFARKRYPVYSYGGAYMMTFNCVAPLFNTAIYDIYITVEDVFITGIVAEKVGITIREVFMFDGSERFHSFAIHGVDAYELYVMWKVYKMTNKVLKMKEIRNITEFAHF